MVNYRFFIVSDLIESHTENIICMHAESCGSLSLDLVFFLSTFHENLFHSYQLKKCFVVHSNLTNKSKLTLICCKINFSISPRLVTKVIVYFFYLTHNLKMIRQLLCSVSLIK